MDAKPKWLFETDVFDEGVHRYVDEARRQGFEAIIASYVPLRSGQTYLDLFDPSDCVVFYGSLEFADQVRQEAPWVPGAFYNREAYRCTHYYPVLSEYLLAQDYVMVPYGDLKGRRDWLYEHLGLDGVIFLRPDSGHKVFTGCLVYDNHFDLDTEHLGFYQVPPHELVVVSPPRHIVAEWRFVVADRRVIAGTMYRRDGHRDWCRDVEPGAYALAQAVATHGYEPDRVWTADVCKTAAGRYCLVEIGTFSCAGLYACDPEPIVREVSRIALDVWSQHDASL